MALVERHSELHARDGSLEGRAGSNVSHAPQTTHTPALAAGHAQAPEPRYQPQQQPDALESRPQQLEPRSLLERAQRHPLARLGLRAGGIALLMLGLGGIGALSMKRGLGAPKLALAEGNHSTPASSSWIAAQASLAGSVPDDNPAPAASNAPAPPARSPGLTEDGRVILNRASIEDLRHLPGVGQKRAEAILALRQKLGKFKRPSDLLRIRGIGPRRLKQLMPKLLVDPPAESAAPAASAASSARALPTASASPIPSASPPATSAPATSAARAVSTAMAKP
ncbi:MAG: ComEA family DNA-binding protein [Myxococcota bacterium]